MVPCIPLDDQNMVSMPGGMPVGMTELLQSQQLSPQSSYPSLQQQYYTPPKEESSKRTSSTGLSYQSEGPSSSESSSSSSRPSIPSSESSSKSLSRSSQLPLNRSLKELLSSQQDYTPLPDDIQSARWAYPPRGPLPPQGGIQVIHNNHHHHHN